jgi:hypothetical protein
MIFKGVLLSLGGALAVAACATLSAPPTANAQRSVYQAESDFAAALPVVVAYENLPVCGANAFPCSDPATVAKVTAAAKAARASLLTAEAAVRSGTNGAALAAVATRAASDVAAFTALAATLGN